MIWLRMWLGCQSAVPGLRDHSRPFQVKDGQDRPFQEPVGYDVLEMRAFGHSDPQEHVPRHQVHSMIARNFN